MHNLIPHFIYEQYRAGNSHGRFQAATLFMDIVGFTAMTQSLMQHGKEGAEVLVAMINQLFEPIINAIYKHGGFVTTFGGDALAVVFPRQGAPAALEAVQAAVRIRQIVTAQGRKATRFGDFDLTVKQGLSAGEVEWAIVGTAEHKNYFFRGPAMAGCALAEHRADGGEIILDQDIQALLPEKALTLSGPDDQFARLLTLRERTIVASSPAQPVAIDPQTMVLFFPLERWQSRQQGEFREAAILFVSFQGISDLAGMDAFFSWVMATVDRLDGYFAEIEFGYKGGLFIVYFGAPTGHENDVNRALEFVTALQAEWADKNLVWRAGLTFGVVYAGYVGTPIQDEYTCMGSVVNLAARLMAHAGWGQVLVSQAVAAHPRYHFSPLGQLPYKGFAQPVPTYLLQGKTPTRQIFEQKMVGREQELQQLAAFAQLLFTEGRAGAALIYGEAGIGKSHLVYELRQQLGVQVRWLMGQSDPIFQEAFSPFIYFLKQYFGQTAVATVSENKASFEHHLQDLLTTLAQTPEAQYQHDELIRTQSFLGALLDLYWPGSLYEQLDARGRYRNTIIAVGTLLQAECRRQPVVLELEDGHWFDEASRELLAALTRQTREMPLFIVLTSRYADNGSWPEFTMDPAIPVLTLELKTLTAAALGELAQMIFDAPIDPTLQSVLMEKSQANPFFAQQILYYLRENDLLQMNTAAGQRVVTLVAKNFALPTTLNTLLIARLDRLAQQVKEVVQTAAVLGREFEWRLLTQMLGRDLTRELVAAEREQIWTVLNALQYIFTHVLLRDAAYEMQLRARLRELHYLAAVAGKQLYAQQLPAYYGILAYHYETASQLGQDEAGEPARHYLRLAGRQALENFENKNAVDYFSRALALVPEEDSAAQYALYLAREEAYDRQGSRVAQTADLARLAALAGTPAQRAAVALRYGAYHNSVGDYAAALAAAEEAYRWAGQSNDSAGQAQAMIIGGRALMRQSSYQSAAQQYRQAETLAQAASPAQMARAWSGLGQVAYRQGDYPTAIQHHEKALTVQQEIDDRQGQMQSLRNLGQVANAQGDYGRAHDYYLQALLLAQLMGDRPHEGRLLLDLGRSDWWQGAYPRAESYLQQSLALAQATGDVSTTSSALNTLGVVAYLQGQFDSAMGCWEQSLAIAQDIGDRIGAGKILNNLGNVAYDQRQYRRATDYYEQSLLIKQEVGDRAGEGKTLNNLGNLAYNQGQYERAARRYAQSLVIKQEIGDRNGEGITLNNLGKVAHVQGQYEQAIRYYEQSLVISQEVGDRASESGTLNNLGLQAYAREQHDTAQGYYEQSLAIAQEIGEQMLAAGVLNNMGALALARDAFSQAQTHYRQALASHQALDQPQFVVEDWAGLALATWRRGDGETARAQAEQLLATWAGTPTLEGAQNPVRTLHFIWQLCRELALPQAEEVLAAAAQLLQRHLDDPPDPAARAAYLGQRHHRPLWRALGGG